MKILFSPILPQLSFVKCFFDNSLTIINDHKIFFPLQFTFLNLFNFFNWKKSDRQLALRDFKNSLSFLSFFKLYF